MLITHEELFLHTVEDLRQKVNSKTPYDLIRACGLCRHLLFDNPSLAHKVNKRRLKLNCQIADYTNTPLSFDYKGSGGRNIEPLDRNTITVTLDKFFKAKIAYYGATEFTVKDILIIAVNNFGGIHSLSPTLKQKRLLHWEQWTKNVEMKMSFWLINSICRVILKALEPLEEEIKNT